KRSCGWARNPYYKEKVHPNNQNLSRRTVRLSSHNHQPKQNPHREDSTRNNTPHHNRSTDGHRTSHWLPSVREIYRHHGNLQWKPSPNRAQYSVEESHKTPHSGEPDN